MKEIKTTNGFPFIVDDEDFEYLSQFSWCNDSNGYAVKRATTKDGTSTTEKMHRMIMNAKPGEVIDHINGNPNDNRKGNLRIVTQSDNRKNNKMYSTNKTGYKGVAIYKVRGVFKGYSAQITVDYKKIHLGVFHSKIEAAKAYNAAAKNYFGEFARLNNITES